MDKNTQKKTKELLKEVPENFTKLVTLAIEYADTNHKDEKRYGGELMLEHLLNTALLSTQVGVDTNSTIACILHEIPLEQKEKEYILKNFNKDVLSILERIKTIKKATDSTDTPDEIVVKYILNSSHDLRPVIIKVLDTLCDMKSVENVPKEMRKESLKKALNIYAVLAEYLDLNEIKKEIEENAFREYMPIEYKSITKKMQEAGIDSKTLEKYQKLLEKTLNSLHFEKKVKGRIKCKYSIYNKLKKYEKE
jgi:(p)ppGpp synthase/HD superfamily hydrolase